MIKNSLSMGCFFSLALLLLCAGALFEPAHAQSRLDVLLGLDSPKQYENVKIEKVLRADTIVLDTGEKIRLIGLESPDPPRRKGNLPTDEQGFPIIIKEDPLTPIEQQAFDFTQSLLQGKKVRLEFDVDKTSSDAKTWAYVFTADNSFVNAEILRKGYANLKIIPPNMKYADQLRGAYQEARREKRGLQSE